MICEVFFEILIFPVIVGVISSYTIKYRRNIWKFYVKAKIRI